MSRKILSNEIIDERLKNRTIKRLGNYIDTRTKIKWKCLKDGYIWFATPANIFSSTAGCPKCAGQIKLSNEIIDERTEGRTIKRIGNFKKTDKIKIKWKCLIDGYVWKTAPNQILRGRGCPKCSNHIELTNMDVDRRLMGRNIKRIGIYKGVRSKIKFKCLICDNVWKARPGLILNSGHGCPSCAIGKSERNIKKLICKYIKYDCFEFHKTFRFNNKKYYPDFYLEIGNKRVIIEYNGEQHYKPVRFNGISQYRANNCFKKQKIRDRQLRNYCKKNNIYLLEIPYHWKENKVINTLKIL